MPKQRVYLGGKNLMDKNAILKTSEIRQVFQNKCYTAHDIVLFRRLGRPA